MNYNKLIVDVDVFESHTHINYIEKIDGSIYKFMQWLVEVSNKITLHACDDETREFWEYRYGFEFEELYGVLQCGSKNDIKLSGTELTIDTLDTDGEMRMLTHP
jgi:hypothetical protein